MRAEGRKGVGAEGARKYQEFVSQRLASAEKAIFIDVHTGIGKFGEDMLLVETEDYLRLRNVFGERVTALKPDQESAYRIEGGIVSMLFRIFSEDKTDVRRPGIRYVIAVSKSFTRFAKKTDGIAMAGKSGSLHEAQHQRSILPEE